MIFDNFRPKLTAHSQLLNIIILKLNSSVLLNLLGNIFPYCPAVRAKRRINSSNICLQEGQCWSCNWECLNCDSSRDIRWNIAWALGKSLGLRPWDLIIYPSSRHNTDSTLSRILWTPGRRQSTQIFTPNWLHSWCCRWILSAVVTYCSTPLI